MDHKGSIGRRLVIWLLACAAVGLPVHRTLAQLRSGDIPRPSTNDDLPSLWTRQNGSDWPSFLGPDRDGKSGETGILTDWSDGKLKIVWTIDTGQGYGIGSVAGGRYFHFDRVQNLARLRCLNAETGKPIWEFSYPSRYDDLYGYDSGPRTSPVIDGNRVYIYGVEGQLYCLNANDGKQIWNVDTGKRFGVVQNFFGVGSTPTIYQDQLLVMVGGTDGEQRVVAPNEFPDIQPDDSAVVAFDKFTGDVKYKLGHDLASYSSIKLAEIHGKTTALVWARSGLFGFDPDTKRTQFQFPWRARSLESVNASTPIVHADSVFISECYGDGGVLLKLNEDNSQVTEIWSDRGQRKKSLATHWNTPVYHEGSLYGSSGRHSGEAQLRCIDFESGQVNWSHTGLSRSSATYVDGHLLVLGEYGELLLVRATPKEFDIVTKLDSGEGVELTYPCWSAPILAHGLLIVRGKKKVVCYELIPE
jgi:outer membrane protein assembly factor BamB